MSKGGIGQPTAPETLEALFAEVVAEARKNPSFAMRLAQALPPLATTEKKTRKPTSTFDPSTCHAINILRQHGEAMLRGRLSGIRAKADLASVAKRSGLRLTGKAARKSASRDDLIDGIVAAAQQYNAQRESAEG